MKSLRFRQIMPQLQNVKRDMSSVNDLQRAEASHFAIFRIFSCVI